VHALVDAHIKGRAAHKRTTDTYFEGKGLKVKSCAVGAIYYGLYGKIPESPITVPTVIAGDWPQFRNYLIPIPCEHREGELDVGMIDFDGDKGNIVGILIHLNDHHPKDWPDKKIQEWLAKTLEEYDRIQTLPQV